MLGGHLLTPCAICIWAVAIDSSLNMFCFFFTQTGIFDAGDGWAICEYDLNCCLYGREKCGRIVITRHVPLLSLFVEEEKKSVKQ